MPQIYQTQVLMKRPVFRRPLSYPSHFRVPCFFFPCNIRDVVSLAKWLDRKYSMMISWTNYDPCKRHGQPLVFDHVDRGYYYDPNKRRVNLTNVNPSGKDWLDNAEFYVYLLHELAHDFLRWDEPY